MKESFSGNSVKFLDCLAFSLFKNLPGCRAFSHSVYFLHSIHCLAQYIFDIPDNVVDRRKAWISNSVLQVVLIFIRTFYTIFNICCHPEAAPLQSTIGLVFCAIKPERKIFLNNFRPMFCSIFVFSCTAYLIYAKFQCLVSNHIG